MATIDFHDLQWVDEPYRLEDIARISGDHDGIIVSTAGQAAWIDRGAAPLVHACWQLGIQTYSSCESLYEGEVGPMAFLEFLTLDSADRFYRAAVPAREDLPEERWEHIVGTWRGEMTPAYMPANREAACGSLVLPVADLGWVVDNLRVALD